MRAFSGAVVAVLSASCLLTGCGGSDDAGDETSTGPTAAATASASGSPSAAVSGSTTSAATVQAASGTTFTLTAMTVTMPADGWVAKRVSAGQVTAYQRGAPTSGLVICYDLPNIADTDLASNAKVSLRTLRANDQTVASMQPDRTVGGVEGWVLRGKTSGGDFFYEYGTVHQAQVVTCDFTWRMEGDPAADPFTQMIEPVLASIDWS